MPQEDPGSKLVSDFRKFTEQEQQAIQELFSRGAFTPCLREACEAAERETEAFRKRTTMSHEQMLRPFTI